jgi:8-oxo-dGTP pyrophosphatase MutT (NUDIX family)
MRDAQDAKASGMMLARSERMYSEERWFKHHVQAVLANRERRTMEDPSLICAAVLIPLLFKQGEWHVLVTQRTLTVEHHKGQISFPGGACDPDDADLQATALRETLEEVGIPPGAVEVLGALDDFPTITSFVVTPFVGSIPYPFAFHLNRHEVEEIIEVPLAFLHDPGNLRVEQWEHQGHLHDVLFWDYGPYTIWGATARMLKNLLDLISG